MTEKQDAREQIKAFIHFFSFVRALFDRKGKRKIERILFCAMYA